MMVPQLHHRDHDRIEDRLRPRLLDRVTRRSSRLGVDHEAYDPKFGECDAHREINAKCPPGVPQVSPRVARMLIHPAFRVSDVRRVRQENPWSWL